MGKGLMQQLDRKFIIHTGRAGMEAIDLLMKKELYRISNKSLLDRGKITISEWMRLEEMIDSPGDDNLIIVESILDFRENNVK